ncbi:Reticulophagy regulator 3 [Holothuria leucospilota]|uniref:Reticulophagy regulator 3 n=1 Tax=Holothuria leucospilota TaxID=206669 RepID=A0A9Q1BFU7_HOLLE|nr:Reticulophagy regulator 3 [Holothuria leucospilota]
MHSSTQQHTTPKMDDERDGLFRSAAENPLSAAEIEKLEREADLRIKEERIRGILSPFEELVMSIQSLLVWENPRRSVLLLLCANGFVWLMVTSHYNIVFKVALSFITIITGHTFYKKVWPDIKVEPKVPIEGWVPLEPELVQFHDLCSYAAVTWQYGVQKHTQFWQLRKEQPGKFCLMVCAICLIISLYGLRVSGAATTYLLVSGIILVPGIIHHDLHQQLYIKTKPYLTQMEHSMDAGTSRHKKRRHKRSPKKKGSASDRDEGDYSSSDSELNEFLPSPGPAMEAAFSHAAANYENTPGSSSRVTPVSGLVGGLMPKGASMEFTDDDLLTDNENNSLAFGPMENIPAYDESDSRLHRPRPPPRRANHPPPSASQPEEPLLTYDMEERHFQAIPAGELSNGSDAFSSEERLDTSPEIQTDEMFDDDDEPDIPVPHLPPDVMEHEQYQEEPKEQMDLLPPDMTSEGQLQNDEPKQEPSSLPQAAADLLSQTVASVSAFISRDRSRSQENDKSSTQIDSHGRPPQQSASAHSSMEPDLSDYEMLDESEIDNVNNSRTEAQSKDNSISEFFSGLFGSKKT